MQTELVWAAGSQIDCLLSLACRPHPATMLRGSQFTGQFRWLWLTNETKAPETHIHLDKISRPSHEHIQQMEKRVAANSFNALSCILNTRCFSGPILISVSRPDGFLGCSQSIRVLSSNTPPESLSVSCWPWRETLTDGEGDTLMLNFS